VRQAQARDPQDTVDVRMDDRLLVLGPRLGERRTAEREPGVVEEDVDPAERLDRGIDEGTARSLARRAPPATRTPASRSRSTVAAPIPDEAPVTTAVLP
jgi:hypothetical protein